MESWIKGAAGFWTGVVLKMILVVAIIFLVSILISYKLENKWIVIFSMSIVFHFAFKSWYSYLEKDGSRSFLGLLMVFITALVFLIGLSTDKVFSNIYLKYSIIAYFGLGYIFQIFNFIKKMFGSVKK